MPSELRLCRMHVGSCACSACVYSSTRVLIIYSYSRKRRRRRRRRRRGGRSLLLQSLRGSNSMHARCAMMASCACMHAVIPWRRARAVVRFAHGMAAKSRHVGSTTGRGGGLSKRQRSAPLSVCRPDRRRAAPLCAAHRDTAPLPPRPARRAQDMVSAAPAVFEEEEEVRGLARRSLRRRLQGVAAWRAAARGWNARAARRRGRGAGRWGERGLASAGADAVACARRGGVCAVGAVAAWRGVLAPAAAGCGGLARRAMHMAIAVYMCSATRVLLALNRMQGR